jgi:hypothetical protein
MKTRDLIAFLQKEDPDGDAECCVGNQDILFVEKQPAYYDGRLEVLERDANGYIKAGRVESNGFKVKIHTAGIEDIIYDNPELPVYINAGNYNSNEEWANSVKKWRDDAVQIKAEIAQWQVDYKLKQSGSQ